VNTAEDAVGSRRQSVLGWIAVTMSAMMGSFFGMFAGGEGVYDGWGAFLAHLAQMLALVLLALAGVRWPRAGGSSLVVAGLGLGLAFGFNPSEAFLFAPLVLMGLFFVFGRVSPRKAAYSIIAGAPAVVTVLTAIMGILLGPGA